MDVERVNAKMMTNQIKGNQLFRYLFLYSLLGYSAFLAGVGRLDASGAVLGGSVALFSLQKSEEENETQQQDDLMDELQLKLTELQHEVDYYKYKLVESDLRTRFQDVVNQNMLEINNLRLENHGFAATVNQEQSENSSKAQKISYLESENSRLREQISKMEKDRILTMKRTVLKGLDGKGWETSGREEEQNIAAAES